MLLNAINWEIPTPSAELKFTPEDSLHTSEPDALAQPVEQLGDVSVETEETPDPALLSTELYLTLPEKVEKQLLLSDGDSDSDDDRCIPRPHKPVQPPRSALLLLQTNSAEEEMRKAMTRPALPPSSAGPFMPAGDENDEMLKAMRRPPGPSIPVRPLKRQFDNRSNIWLATHQQAMIQADERKKADRQIEHQAPSSSKTAV